MGRPGWTIRTTFSLNRKIIHILRRACHGKPLQFLQTPLPLKGRQDDVAHGYAADDGQGGYNEGRDEDQGIVLEDRHGLEDVRKDVYLAVEEDVLDQGPHEDHDDDGGNVDQPLFP